MSAPARPLARWLPLATAPLLFVGCLARARTPLTVFNDVPPASYHPDRQNKDVLLYRSPDVDITAYTRFLIEPVRIVSNKSYAVLPAEEAALADGFRQTLIETLKDGYRVVERPGDGVLRIRAAIQDIQPARPAPFRNSIIELRLDTRLARAALELECVDSVSGTPVAALVYTLHGRRYFEKEKATRLLNLRDAFDVWTQSLKKRFDAARTAARQQREPTHVEENERLHFEEGE